jgi:hypothetical protein
MELSTIVKEYNIPLTRSESRLVALLPSGQTAESPERYDQRMKALAGARDVLKQLPDKQTSERRSRMEKAAMLKERLKMLRQMIPFLSPSAAKSLKSEMKQIAAQIASLSGGGGGSAAVAMDAPATGTAASAQSAGTVQNAGTSSDTDQGDSKNLQESHALPGVELSGQEVKNDPGANAEERTLKETVAELKTLFKTVLEALKRKQQVRRASGQFPENASSLRVYVAMPEHTRRVAINV